MNCVEFQQRLQHRLDGETSSSSAADLLHIDECRNCRELHMAASKLLDRMNREALPRPPANLSKRITRSVLRERRRQVVYRTAAVSALAAGVMVAAYVGFLWQRGAFSPNHGNAPAVATRVPTGADASEFSANVEGAYVALTGIVNQTAERALNPGRVLLPDRDSVAFLTETAKLQPQVPSLRAAGQGVAEFAPVASFGRFLNYFAQDIPGIEPKPTSDS